MNSIADDYPSDYDLVLGRILRDHLKLLLSKGRISEVHRVREAIDRLYNEDFGRCRSCGGFIPYLQLFGDPAATECAACERLARVRAA